MSQYFISADLEGVCGVSTWQDCYPATDDSRYRAAVEQLASEITSVVDAIRSVQNDAQIVVNDAHNAMINLGLEHLPSGVQLISGKPKLCAMMAGLDSTFNGVILLGYHAKAGTEKGVLNHTFHNQLYDVSINGVSLGEGGVNALYAQLCHNVPVILGCGDQAFCEEFRALLPGVSLVETKSGLTTTAALHRPAKSVRDELYAQTRQALQQLAKAPDTIKQWAVPVGEPFTLTITFTHTLCCDTAMTSPAFSRVDGRTLKVTAKDFQTIYQHLQTAYTMLSYSKTLETV